MPAASHVYRNAIIIGISDPAWVAPLLQNDCFYKHTNPPGWKKPFDAILIILFFFFQTLVAGINQINLNLINKVNKVWFSRGATGY